ncbi:putative YT521-B-like splicing factor [Aspergillus tanneri]|uniref:YTH domain-containing protein n=1 Tax=Aspergillus tanneri TaxID=1220188 RepID=A0A5M9M9K4_9EURO|nr:uncharacterized protein ATNIH1004_011101 [Aspergillus tanneri]KAA8642160.1 hypothetical protein ATNIH1004_011101 [Aspergillus tanneri]
MKLAPAQTPHLWPTKRYLGDKNHNEDSLNHAHETADNVCLIFSVNKSGKYYGYARMISPIQDDDDLILVMPSRPDHVHPESQDLEVTSTLAASTASNGWIIADGAHGTILGSRDIGG